MSKSNIDCLVDNVERLRKEKNISQAELADMLESSQPNISKALNQRNGAHFTLEQVIRLSEIFSVSIDYLLGKTRTELPTLTQQTVATMMARLIEANAVRWEILPVEEEVYEPVCDEHTSQWEYEKKNKTIDYIAFYFPEVETVDPEYGFPELEGNRSEMWMMNKFLTGQLSVLKLLQENILTYEQYEFLLRDTIAKLPKK